MNETTNSTKNTNMASLILGAVLILAGVLFLFGKLLGNIFHFDFGHYTWPLFVILPGVLLFLLAFVLERQSGLILAILGGIVATAGFLLLVQNTFDIYASWAYAWALVAPTSIGLSKIVYGGLRKMENQVRGGLSLAGIGLTIFILGGVFFELVIGINGLHFAGAWMCWPVLLIGLGVVLLLSSLLRGRKSA